MSTTQRVDFPNRDGQSLAGRLELPAGASRGGALFAHCFTCSKDIAAATRIARALCARGYTVLRFDFTGLGHSEGEFGNTSFSSNTDDLVAAADFLREHHGAPSLLIGHSLGGAAVLHAAPRIPEARAVATIGAPARVEHLRKLLRDDLATIEGSGAARVQLAGREFTIKKQFLDDLERHDLDDLKDLRVATAIFHSPVDNVVSIDHAALIYQALKHPKSFITLDDADHLLTRAEDAEYVASVLAAWAARYLPELDETSEVPEGEVHVEQDRGSFQTRVATRSHRFVADEPVRVGGTDKGPNPYELLLSALGACTSMTLHMYAKHKKWPLERVAVELRHDRIHAADCADCEKEDGQIDRIERELELDGPLDEAQRTRLLEIADRCPVHRTLMNEKQIVTRLTGAGG